MITGTSKFGNFTFTDSLVWLRTLRTVCVVLAAILFFVICAWVVHIKHTNADFDC